jgi:hypothetical protein
VRQSHSNRQSIVQERSCVIAAADEMPLFMRGVLHAVILSSAVWVATFYLTFVLR